MQKDVYGTQEGEWRALLSLWGLCGEDVHSVPTDTVSVALSCVHIRCSQCLQDCLKVGSDLELDQRETLGSLLTRTP